MERSDPRALRITAEVHRLEETNIDVLLENGTLIPRSAETGDAGLLPRHAMVDLAAARNATKARAE